ncbi:MFS transporter [Mangrovicella endophytica]|uniref:MFS transporter n=1 Tax=Mangrovicella endophytica TaxID=2066697 RepID=UPI000C9EAAA7|nr:MFS transporter [Mangrovicella endophytica]
MSDTTAETILTEAHVETLPPEPATRLPFLTIALIEFALAVGSFGIGTGEFAIMGMLPDVARDFAVTMPQAGYVISAYAVGVVVGAPVIAVCAARLARRQLLLLLMSIFALGNIVSAIAPGFASFTLLRFLTGLPHGAYFGVAALVAASMQEPHNRAKAVGRVMLGLSVSILIGTPLASWLGQIVSWRVTFALVGALGILTAVLIAAFLPADKPHVGASPLRELGAFRRKQVWYTLGIASIGFGGLFSVFTYVASTATLVARMPETAVPIIMAIFGAGAITGNLVGAWLADRALMRTIGGVLIWDAAVMTVLWLTASNPVMLCLCVFLVGCGIAIGPSLQTRLMDVAEDAQTLAAALNHSAFNVANALGAWLGGLAIAAGYGFQSTGWVGALLAVAGFGVFLLSLLSDRRTARRTLAAAA